MARVMAQQLPAARSFGKPANCSRAMLTGEVGVSLPPNSPSWRRSSAAPRSALLGQGEQPREARSVRWQEDSAPSSLIVRGAGFVGGPCISGPGAAWTTLELGFHLPQRDEARSTG